MSRYPTPDRARFLEDLSPAMGRALVRCATRPVLVADPAAAGVKPVTVDALVRHGLLVERRDKRARPVWRPSERGAAILVASRPRLLAARSQYGYVSEPADALPDEPEAVDRDDRLAREQRRHDSDEGLLAGRRELEEELGELRRLAAERGVDIRNDLRVISARVERIRRRVREQRDGARRAMLDEALQAAAMEDAARLGGLADTQEAA